MSETAKDKIRILLAMPGLDGHERGIVYLARELRKAGMEVIYLGVYNTPDQIVKAAIEEDVDVIGLSYLKDALYMYYFSQVMELLREEKATDICVVTGGRFLNKDRAVLEDMGVTGIFQHDASMEEIVRHITDRVRERNC